MKAVTGFFFESKVRLEKTTEDGTLAKINEMFVVNAMSFTECEGKIVDYVSQYTQGEFDVLTEAHAKYREIFFSEEESEDIFYRVKVDFVIPDERTGKDKHSKSDYLVQGSTIDSAKKNVDDVLKESMTDYKIVSVSETAIVDYVG